MAWIVKLVSIGAAGDERSTEVMRIARPDDLTDLTTLGLTLAEGKQLLAGVQQELVAAQARRHAARRPACRSCCSRLVAWISSVVALGVPQRRSALVGGLDYPLPVATAICQC